MTEEHRQPEAEQFILGAISSGATEPGSSPELPLPPENPRRDWAMIGILTLALVLVLFRFKVPPQAVSLVGCYRAGAHLFVGGLLFGGLFTPWLGRPGNRRFCLVLCGLLGLVEIGAFVMSHR